jgi:S1-C subfamily serine protease
MKAKWILLIILFQIFQNNTYSQKYRTLEQYQNHFIQNIEIIDQIEGIWHVNLSNYLDGSLIGRNEFIVAIILENGNFAQYTIEDGYYKPSPITSNFTYSGYSYKFNRNNRENNITTSATSSVNSKTISFELNMYTEMKYVSNNSFNGSVVFKYSYQKIFPLESDIEKIKKPEKVEKSSGTGFAISSDGYIVTNYHVVENATKIKVKGVKGDFSKSYSAKVMVSDKNNDLAILKIDDYSFSSLGVIPYIIKSTPANVGENIFVLGYPLTATMGEEIKLTNGIISSKSGFQGDITSYQMTAPIQSGNSGAPMFDKVGNIAGIVNAKHVGAENAGYAVKTSYLFNLIDALPTTLKLPTVNTLKGKTLSSQVEIANKFVYIIEVE